MSIPQGAQLYVPAGDPASCRFASLGTITRGGEYSAQLLIPSSVSRSPNKDRWYKTRMCEYYSEGRCYLGGKCRRAHTLEELRMPERHSPRHRPTNLASQNACSTKVPLHIPPHLSDTTAITTTSSTPRAFFQNTESVGGNTNASWFASELREISSTTDDWRDVSDLRDDGPYSQSSQLAQLASPPASSSSPVCSQGRKTLPSVSGPSDDEADHHHPPCTPNQAKSAAYARLIPSSSLPIQPSLLPMRPHPTPLPPCTPPGHASRYGYDLTPITLRMNAAKKRNRYVSHGNGSGYHTHHHVHHNTPGGQNISRYWGNQGAPARHKAMTHAFLSTSNSFEYPSVEVSSRGVTRQSTRRNVKTSPPPLMQCDVNFRVLRPPHSSPLIGARTDCSPLLGAAGIYDTLYPSEVSSTSGNGASQFWGSTHGCLSVPQNSHNEHHHDEAWHVPFPLSTGHSDIEGSSSRPSDLHEAFSEGTAGRNHPEPDQWSGGQEAADHDPEWRAIEECAPCDIWKQTKTAGSSTASQQRQNATLPGERYWDDIQSKPEDPISPRSSTGRDVQITSRAEESNLLEELSEEVAKSVLRDV